MDDFDGTYAPQSPDLSGFQTFDTPDPFSQTSYYPPQHQQQQFEQQSPYPPQPTNHHPFQFGQPNPQFPQNPYPQTVMPTNGKMKSLADHDDDEYTPEASTAKGGGSRRSKKPKIEEDICDKLAPGVEEGIEVKTKFPVARIKRIMQADDDVGKVAQVTPTAVSKALELFMISVVTKAANEARAKGSKRVTAAHLKRAVEKEEQLDFLNEIVSKVPDAPTASKKEKEKDEDSEEGGGSKRKKTTTRRKKKDDDDF